VKPIYFLLPEDLLEDFFEDFLPEDPIKILLKDPDKELEDPARVLCPPLIDTTI
jgi:hypothetical protein